MKNTLLKRTVQLALLAAVLSSSSCKEDKKSVTYLLIDRSVSVSDEFTRLAYSEDARKITSKLQEGDIIIFNTITANSLATSTPVKFEIPSYSFFRDNKDVQASVNDSVYAVIKDAVEKLIGEANEVQTDILNSVLNATTTLRREEYSDFKKLIIIFSDMEQITEELDLAHANLNDKEVQNIIVKLAKAHMIPDMTNMSVVITGAGLSASGNNSFNIRKTQFLKKFWLDYFRACNASISESDYAARLTE